MNGLLRRAWALVAGLAMLGVPTIATFTTAVPASASDCEPGSGCTFGFGQPPVFGDNGPYEFGVKFSSDVAGFITHVCYWQAEGDVGTNHHVMLWDSDGLPGPLATATGAGTPGTNNCFAFDAPVQIAAGTIYTASYNSADPAVHHGVNYQDDQFLGPVTVGHLTAPANAGVFAQPAGTFPVPDSGTNFHDGYGVQPVFVTGPTAFVAPGVSVGAVTVTEGDDGSSAASVPVSLSWPSSSPVSVTYTTVAGTAAAPGDFEAVAPTVLTFAPGETVKSVPVAIVGDEVSEGLEKLSVKLSGPVGGTLADSTSSVTIIDDDAPLSVSVSDAQVLEGSSGLSDLAFAVSLSAPVPAGKSVTVTVATADRTALGGSDYSAIEPAVLTFGPGESTKPVTVSVNGDVAVEANESLSLKLTVPVGAVIADNTGIGTIVNDDGSKPVLGPPPTVVIGDTTVTEGDSGTATALIPVTLSQASAAPVTVSYVTANSGAKAPGDYQQVPSTVLTFDPGETAKSIPVEIVGDSVRESMESLLVNLSSPAGATIGDASVRVNILDQDTTLGITVSDAVVAEGTGDTAAMAFEVSLSSPVPAGQSVTVEVATANGSAKAGTDFTALPTTVVTFGPGEQTTNVTIEVTGDSLKERNETLTLRATNAVGAILDDTYGLGTIVDND